MKPPILRVKKGAAFYDDSEEEAEVLTPPRRQPPPRRGRSGGRSIIAPLIAVAAVLLLVFRFLPHGPTSRTTLSGWQVTLKVNRLPDGLVAGVTFVARSRSTAVPAATARVSVRGTAEQVFLAGDLDKSPLTLRGRLADLSEARLVQAEVTIGTARVLLVAPVPPPLPPSAAASGG